MQDDDGEMEVQATPEPPGPVIHAAKRTSDAEGGRFNSRTRVQSTEYVDYFVRLQILHTNSLSFGRETEWPKYR